MTVYSLLLYDIMINMNDVSKLLTDACYKNIDGIEQFNDYVNKLLIDTLSQKYLSIDDVILLIKTADNAKREAIHIINK